MVVHMRWLLQGFCHVTFESVEAAQAAVGCDGQYLGERWLQIKLAARPSGSHTNGRSSTIRTAQPAGCKTLFARNIAYVHPHRGSSSSKTRRGISLAPCSGMDVRWCHARAHRYSADEKLLSKHFAAAGTVPIEVRIPRDFHTERPKGYAYIQLADEEDAAKAMAALEATELLGRPIFLDVRAPPPTIRYHIVHTSVILLCCGAVGR
jgi:RNA recognition motif-containing protein